VELVNEPKAFFFNEWEALGTLPQFPAPPLLACLTLSFEGGERNHLMSVILLLIRGNVHGARLKPYELVGRISSWRTR
jgi:hypothetical protein